jgi:hypothetical protein
MCERGEGERDDALRWLPRSPMIAAARSTPSIAVRIVGRRRRTLRRTARHRLGKLHRRRRLHLHGVYRARRERDLLYAPRMQLSVAVGLARLGEQSMRSLSSPRVHGQGCRDGLRLIGAQLGGCRDGGQFVLVFVTGRAGGRIRYAVYGQTRHDLVARRRIYRQDREEGRDRIGAKTRRLAWPSGMRGDGSGG